MYLQALVLAIAIATAPVARAQQDRAIALDTDSVAADVQALTNFSALPGISTAQFRIDALGDPKIDTYKLPFSDEREVEGLGPPLYREFSLGYLKANQALSTEDFAFEANFRALSTYGGVGIGIDLGGLKLRPIASVSYAYLRNQTEFGGTIGDEIAEEVEGILADFGVSAITFGGSLDAVFERSVDGFDVELGARFNRLLTTSFLGTTDVLEGTTGSNLLTTRYVVSGPVGTIGPVPVRLQLNLANTTLFGAQRSALGFPFFIEIGGGLDFALEGGGRSLGLRGSIIRGESVEGFSIGISADF